MKRKFSDRANWRRILKKSYACIPIDEPEFKGFVTLYFIHQIKEPLWKEYNGRKICLANRNYLWMQYYPKAANFIVTTMFDYRGNVVQWYIDICKTQGLTDQNIPWFDDLYLDIVVLPTGQTLLLDEDELEEALYEGDITSLDVTLAKKTADKLLAQIKNEQFPYFEMSVRHRKIFLQKLNWKGAQLSTYSRARNRK